MSFYVKDANIIVRVGLDCFISLDSLPMVLSGGNEETGLYGSFLISDSSQVQH